MKLTENSITPKIIDDYKMMMFKLMNRPKIRDDQKMCAFEKLANQFASGWPFKNNETLATFGAEHPYKNVLEKYARNASEMYRRIEEIRKGRDIGRMDKTEGESNLAYKGKSKKQQTQKPEIIKKTQD